MRRTVAKKRQSIAPWRASGSQKIAATARLKESRPHCANQAPAASLLARSTVAERLDPSMLQLAPLYAWIQSTSVATLVSQSLLLNACLSSLHLVGGTLLVGGVLVSSLRLMGAVLRGHPVADVTGAMRTGILSGSPSTSSPDCSWCRRGSPTPRPTGFPVEDGPARRGRDLPFRLVPAGRARQPPGVAARPASRRGRRHRPRSVARCAGRRRRIHPARIGDNRCSVCRQALRRPVPS